MRLISIPTYIFLASPILSFGVWCDEPTTRTGIHASFSQLDNQKFTNEMKSITSNFRVKSYTYKINYSSNLRYPNFALGTKLPWFDPDLSILKYSQTSKISPSTKEDMLFDLETQIDLSDLLLSLHRK